MRKTYTFDLSDFDYDEPIRVNCVAQEVGEEWICDMDLDPKEYNRSEFRTIRDSIRKQFETDLKHEYRIVSIRWKGDRINPLLRLKPGDRVTFKGGKGEIVYVVPNKRWA
jgi:hypothetical protein